MTSTKTYTWTVRGIGLFPFDMLRYDYCWPASERDSAKIENRGHSKTREITLRSLAPEPTLARWKSFGWEVVGG
jgi:hypothetical protein